MAEPGLQLTGVSSFSVCFRFIPALIPQILKSTKEKEINLVRRVIFPGTNPVGKISHSSQKASSPPAATPIF